LYFHLAQHPQRGFETQKQHRYVDNRATFGEQQSDTPIGNNSVDRLRKNGDEGSHGFKYNPVSPEIWGIANFQHHLRRISPFVVVPSQHFDQIAVDHSGHSQVDDSGVGAPDDIGGSDMPSVCCNLSSIYGIISAPDLPPYHASKGAVRLMTKTDALLYAGDDIRVNSIHPGYIWTPLVADLAEASGQGVDNFRRELDAKHPIGHIGEPDDVAYGALYLAADESKFVTGSELVIDGGYTAQ